MNPRTTLDHWNVFKTVIEQGSFHKAAEHLGRSQSTVSYAVQKLQEQLGATLIETRGRKTQLTPIGALLLEDGKAMVEGMLQIEGRARSLAKGHEIKVRLGIASCVPPVWLTPALATFRARFPNTLLDVDFLDQTALAAGFQNRRADLYLMTECPVDGFSEEIGRLKLRCVAPPTHPLAKLGRALSRKDLALSQVVTCDGGFDEHGESARAPSGFTSAVAWRFNRFDAALDAIQAGMGYGWLPEHLIEASLAQHTLVPLPLAEGAECTLMLQLIYQNRYGAGPATLHLADQLKSVLSQRVR